MNIHINTNVGDTFVLGIKIGKCIDIRTYLNRTLLDLALEGFMKTDKYQVSYIISTYNDRFGIELVNRIMKAFLEVK